MKYTFYVPERISLQSMLPDQGNGITMKIVDTLLNDVGFDEKELEELNITSNDQGKITWNQDADKGKEVELGEKGKEIITNVLE